MAVLRHPKPKAKRPAVVDDIGKARRLGRLQVQPSPKRARPKPKAHPRPKPKPRPRPKPVKKPKPKAAPRPKPKPVDPYVTKARAAGQVAYGENQDQLQGEVDRNVRHANVSIPDYFHSYKEDLLRAAVSGANTFKGIEATRKADLAANEASQTQLQAGADAHSAHVAAQMGSLGDVATASKASSDALLAANRNAATYGETTLQGLNQIQQGEYGKDVVRAGRDQIYMRQKTLDHAADLRKNLRQVNERRGAFEVDYATKLRQQGVENQLASATLGQKTADANADRALKANLGKGALKIQQQGVNVKKGQLRVAQGALGVKKGQLKVAQGGLAIKKGQLTLQYKKLAAQTKKWTSDSNRASRELEAKINAGYFTKKGSGGGGGGGSSGKSFVFKLPSGQKVRFTQAQADKWRNRSAGFAEAVSQAHSAIAHLRKKFGRAPKTSEVFVYMTKRQKQKRNLSHAAIDVAVYGYLSAENYAQLRGYFPAGWVPSRYYAKAPWRK